MNKLQKSLSINALFSGTSGVLLIVFKNQLANFFDLPFISVFWIIGLGLLIFTSTIVYQIKRQHYLGVMAIILQDFLWVVASAALLFLQPVEISTGGNWTIAIVALIVLLMGINQVRALAQVKQA